MRLLLLLAVLAAAPARAQWEPLPLPAGASGPSVGSFGAVVALGDAVFVAPGGGGIPTTPGSSDYALLFVSRNGGATWAAVPEFTGPAGAYQIGRPEALDGTLYVPRVAIVGGAYVASTVLRTTDGAAWTAPAGSGLNPNERPLRNVARQGGVLYGVSTDARSTPTEGDGFVYASADEGQTWTRGVAIASGFLYSAGTHLLIGYGRFANTQGQRSADGGATWTPHGSLIMSAVRTADGAALTASGVLRRSTDGGATFNPVTGAPRAVGVGTCGTTVLAADFLTTTGQPHVWRSDDSGLTFVGWADGLPDEGLNGLGFSCSTGAGGSGYAYHTTLGGSGVYRRALSGTTAAGDAPEASALALSVAPNPAAHGARLALSLAEAATVRVTVVDALGRTVARVHDGPLAAGPHALALPDGLAPGLYVARVEAGAATGTVRFTVAR